MLDVYKSGDVVVIICEDDESGLYEKDIMFEIADYGFNIGHEQYFSIRKKRRDHGDYEEYQCPVSFLRKATKKEKFLYELFGPEALIEQEHAKDEQQRV